MPFDFYASGVPARVLCLEPGADRWSDVPTALLAELQHAFACGKPFARARLADGRGHVFHFARMLRYDEAHPGAPTAASLSWYDEAGAPFFPPGKAHLPVDPSDARAVGEAEAVAIVRGWTSDAAVVTGAEACIAGDALTRTFRMGIAEADHTGEACMLLCCIVHGLPGAIHAGSNQFGNTRHELNSVGGVDYLPNPSWYVVWTGHMNVCIIPLCVVRFMKRPAQVLGPLISCIPVFVDMKKLRKEIKRFLPSSQLQDLDHYFDTDMGNTYNFSRCVCELIGVDMFAGAVLKTLEH